MNITEIIDWVSANWVQITAAVGGLVLTARVVVKLTPTPKDDAILAKVVTVLKHIGLHVDSK